MKKQINIPLNIIYKYYLFRHKFVYILRLYRDRKRQVSSIDAFKQISSLLSIFGFPLFSNVCVESV